MRQPVLYDPRPCNARVAVRALPRDPLASVRGIALGLFAGAVGWLGIAGVALSLRAMLP